MKHFQILVYSIFIAGLLSLSTSVCASNRLLERYEAPNAYVDSFPTPRDIDNLLFYIQRDPNTNTICYTLNIGENGKIDTSTPISAFWIRYPEGGVKKELNFIQRKFAYGINAKKLADGSYDVRSVAYSKLPLRLKKDAKGMFRVYADINNKEAILERIFIRIGDGGTFWKPDVKYIELKGVEVGSGKRTLVRFKP